MTTIRQTIDTLHDRIQHGIAQIERDIARAEAASLSCGLSLSDLTAGMRCNLVQLRLLQGMLDKLGDNHGLSQELARITPSYTELSDLARKSPPPPEWFEEEYPPGAPAP